LEIDSYQYWMNKLAGKSPNTLKTYRSLFANFLGYIKMTPNELIALKQKCNGSNADPRECAIVEDRVLDWINNGLGNSKSSATKRTGLAVVMCFFNCNKHPLSLDKNDYERADSVGSRIPTKEEIAKIADCTTGWKFRAAVIVLKDSGLRCSDLRKLIWEAKQDLGDGFWHWTIVTEKRNVKAEVFIGPEATRLLANFKTKQGRIFPTSTVVMNFRLNEAIRKAKIQGVTAHGLRKFHTTSLQHGRVPDAYILAMEGKRTSVYSETRPDVLFEAYKNAYKELSLAVGNGQAIEKAKEDIERLQRENEDLKVKVGRMEGSKEGLELLLQRVLELEKKLNEQKNA
jgi:integrase